MMTEAMMLNDTTVTPDTTDTPNTTDAIDATTPAATTGTTLPAELVTENYSPCEVPFYICIKNNVYSIIRSFYADFSAAVLKIPSAASILLQSQAVPETLLGRGSFISNVSLFFFNIFRCLPLQFYSEHILQK